MPTLSLTVFETRLPKAYRAYFYERDYGDLEDVVTVDTFEAGVQLVRDRLARDGDYVITASWIKHQGEMTVATPHGTVAGPRRSRRQQRDHGAARRARCLRQHCGPAMPRASSNCSAGCSKPPETVRGASRPAIHHPEGHPCPEAGRRSCPSSICKEENMSNESISNGRRQRRQSLDESSVLGRNRRILLAALSKAASARRR